MTVRQLLDSIDSRELSEWMAYYRLEPWGEERADYRAGIVAAATVNVWKGSGSPVKPSDFLPDYGAEEKQPPTPEELAARLKAITLMYGGTIDGEHR